ncbi:MAG: CehA/McbA family metallohydrolase [Bacteroidales bacterium]|nr:CehA/McbA family metallohydrolase [Bacteroidales bacterium]
MKQIIFIILLCIIVNVSAQSRYYKAQMHCHTTNSDGNYTPRDLIKKYRDAGYEILMITDHNFLTDGASYNVPGILCIKSEEITFDRHMNGFFLDHAIIPNKNFDCQDAIDSVKAQGGIIQLNHYCAGPLTPVEWVVSAAEIMNLNNGPDILEIFNTAHELSLAHDDKTIWDSLLTVGKIVWGGADDDFHPHVLESIEFNQAWNMIFLDSLTENNVYQAIKNGNFYASTGVEIYNYNITNYNNFKIIEINSNATKIDFWGPGHTLLYSVNGGYAQYTLQDYSYVRAELSMGTDNKKYAWTQPVFMETTNNVESQDVLPIINLYPNPASTTISLSLIASESIHAKLKIIDILGRQQIEIFDGLLKPYKNIINYDVSYLDSGQYYILIETKNGYKVLPLQIVR